MTRPIDRNLIQQAIDVAINAARRRATSRYSRASRLYCATPLARITAYGDGVSATHQPNERTLPLKSA
jgi:hypothetical protein